MKNPTVCWFKHGPYDENESLCCVFNDPNDSDYYSPLIFAKDETAYFASFEDWWQVTYHSKLGTAIMEEAFKEVAKAAWDAKNTV
jgi:hypothetical protein